MKDPTYIPTMTDKEKLDEIQLLLGLFVEDAIELNKLKEKQKNSSCMYWASEGGLITYAHVIECLAPYFTPEDIEEGTRIAINKLGEVTKK